MKQPRRVALLSLFALLFTNYSLSQNSTARLEMLPAEIHPLSPEMTGRFAALRRSLQPSAESWVDEQARTETQRPAPDLAALRAQIRARFASSLSAKEASPGVNRAPGSDIDAMAFVVLVEAVNDTNQDLLQMMSTVKALTDAKQQARNLLNQVNHDLASAGPNAARQPCRTTVCASLPAQLKQLAIATASSKRPVRTAVSGNLTYSQLQQIAVSLSGDLSSLSDLSQQEQLQLQMAMDQRAKFEQALSNVMKAQQDASAGILSSLR